jgi:lysozyme
MKTNKAGRKIILKHEGYSTVAYPDPYSLLAIEMRKPPAERNPNWTCLPGDPWTIGIGETGPGIGPGTSWTPEVVSVRFEARIAEVESQVDKAVECCLNENQFSALVSWVFNEGIGQLLHGGPKHGSSTLLEKLNEGDFLGAAAEFVRWDIGGGHHSHGLRERRLDEQALFLTPVISAAA